MQFKAGTGVYAADEAKVGDIERVVLDPRTREVTHLVIEEGFLFKEAKVLPIDLVAVATEDRVTLREIEGELNLPKFEETHYIPTDEVDDMAGPDNIVDVRHGEFPSTYARPLYNYPPVGVAWWGYPGFMSWGDGEQDYATAIERNIPEYTVALEEGARVLAKDDKHVGDVERVLIDSRTDRATHIVISRGLLLKKEKVVPTSWISTITENDVILAVESDMLERLPEYERS